MSDEAATPPPAKDLESPSGRRRIIRLYSSAPDAKRFRRPTDVVLLAISVVAILGLAIVAPGPTDLDESITELLKDLPGAAGWLWQVAYALLTLWALLLVVAVLFSRGRRRLLGDFGLAAAIALLLAAGASRLAGTELDEGLRSFFSPGPPPIYLAIRVAVVTAVVVTASPHLTRPLRNIARAIIAIGAVAGVGLGVSFPIGVAAGFCVGLAAAAVAHLILGSPGGHPTTAQVEADLAEIGVLATDIRQTSFTVPGVGLFAGTQDDDGNELLIKVYARDSWDDQWLTATWSSLMRRGETAASGSSRLHRVEHEAVVSLMAQRAGVSVMPLVAVGETDDGDALLATRLTGIPLADLDSADVTDDFLASCWKALRALHDAGMSHGQIDDWRILRAPDGLAVLGDLGSSVLAAGDLAKRSDDVRLLVTTAIVVGHDRAMANGASKT